MGKNLIQKIIASHLIAGEMIPGSPIEISIDQALIHDLTGMLPVQAIDSMNLDRVRTSVAVAYADHNTLEVSTENTNDHNYLYTCSKKYGLYYSKPGNGVCHFVHLQRFAVPGQTLLGADSHTPSAGAVGMLAIGSGGLSITKALVGEGFKFKMPKVIEVRLTGEMRPGVSSKDIILELLRRLTVKGGVGCALEFTGSGLEKLTVTQRNTITNMCTELGATTGIFPSDEQAKAFLRSEGREDQWIELKADEDAVYDSLIEIDLDTLEPLVACPHMPDKVVPVRELAGLKVDQVFIGSCTNGSYSDHIKAAALLAGKKIPHDVNLSVAPGSKQVMEALMANGALADYVSCGARVLECACGPCVGCGQAPFSKGVSVRTSNRNFLGRGGTVDAMIYLTSPETAAATALTGYLTDPTTLPEIEKLRLVEELPEYTVDDCLLVPPLPIEEAHKVEVVRGSNIAPLPMRGPLEDNITAKIGIVTGDNITTDDIIPASPEILKNISNIPKFAEYAFCYIDKDYVERAKKLSSSVIIGGENYGQGSSREHAALIPMYFGVKAVIAKSFARIHKENLINFGILPLTFANPADYDEIKLEDDFEIKDTLSQINGKQVKFTVSGKEYTADLNISDDDRALLLAGGLLNYLKAKAERS